MATDLTRAGFDVWYDEWEIRVGDQISQKIERGLSKTDFVVVLLTKRSVESGWVEREWQSKVGKEAQSRGVLILPVKGEQCEIPYLLRDKRYADIEKDYEAGIRDLIGAIRSHFAEMAFEESTDQEFLEGPQAERTVPSDQRLLKQLNLVSIFFESGRRLRRLYAKVRIYFENERIKKRYDKKYADELLARALETAEIRPEMLGIESVMLDDTFTILQSLAPSLTMDPLAKIDLESVREEINTWLYGIYFQQTFRINSESEKLRFSCHLDLPKELFSLAFRSGEKDVTAETFRSQWFSDIDAHIRDALIKLVPILRPQTELTESDIDRLLVEKPEDVESYAEYESLGVYAPAIIYSWFLSHDIGGTNASLS